jgi:hypothetical protein
MDLKKEDEDRLQAIGVWVWRRLSAIRDGKYDEVFQMKVKSHSKNFSKAADNNCYGL